MLHFSPLSVGTTTYSLLTIISEFNRVSPGRQFFCFTTESSPVTSRLSILFSFIGHLEQVYLNNDLVLVKLLVRSLRFKKTIEKVFVAGGLWAACRGF